MDLQGKTAIVSGASSGLGLATAEALVGRGVLVAGLARDRGRLLEARERLGTGFSPIVCDVSDSSAVARAVHQTQAALGAPDILINNAGVGRFAALEELKQQDWNEMMGTNLSGVYHLCREVVPSMKERGTGHIVNVVSIAGLVGNANLAGYNASKFAVRGLSEALMKELRDYGVKVTAVYPGSIETAFSPPSMQTTRKLSATEVAEIILHTLERSENCLISEVVVRPLRPRS